MVVSTIVWSSRPPGTWKRRPAVVEIPNVREATVLSGGLALSVDQARTVLPVILSTTAAAGLSVRSVEVKEPDLEAVFLHLTGKDLRD